MKSVATLLVFIAILSFARATSDSIPSLVYLCDAHSERLGCNPEDWTGGNRLKCKNTTQIMAWASKPVRSDCYTLVAGEDESSPVSYYEPGKVLMIHVRVNCYGMLYRGIQLYAVNENEEKVGDWEIPDSDPTEFKRPWDTEDSPCFGTLMHSSAEYKPYHSILYFKTPAVGSGKIAFRCLIKYGNANTGAFFWPSTDLVLEEKPEEEVPVTFYKMSEAGQSCSDLCVQTEGYVCDEQASTQLQDPSFFSKEFLTDTVCVLPLLSGCGSQAATYDPIYQYCYYPEANCAAQNRSVSYSTCDTAIDSTPRFCACTEESAMSAGSSLRGFSALLVLALFFVNPRAAMFVLLCFGLTSAHNWINSPSRSNGASTYQPFKPAVTDMPHAQVGPGQAFQIEWMTAHGGFTYFAIVHQSNEQFMKQVNSKLLEEYIKNAPAEARTNASIGAYQRLHRKDNNTLDNDFPAGNTPATMPNFFARFINATDPLYINRSANWDGSKRAYLVAYKPQDLAQDVRVSYQSTVYPWLEAVYKFKMSALQAVRPDVANFWIPGYAGYGRYLVQYIWSGYRDVIDVDYMPAIVPNVYGVTPNASRWRRIDHCLFERPRVIFEVSEIVSDAEWCLRRCAARGNCWGVNVVPMQAPDTAYVFPSPVEGTNWFYPNIYGTDIYVPWNYTIFNSTWRAQLLSKASPQKYMCFTVQPADFTDTTDEYTVSRDPDDPIFYSTCYYKYRGNVFPGYPDTTAPTVSSGPWRFYDNCVTCDSQSTNAYPGVIPQWTVSDKCVNCDMEPSTLKPPAKPALNLVERGITCDGYANSFSRSTHHNCTFTNSCSIQIFPLGRTVNDFVTLDECRVLAERHPNCSNNFMWIFNTTTNKCFCYSNNPCCYNCSRKVAATLAVYEVKSTPDPTCATGTLSADGLSCCSASCGAGNCLPSAGIVNPVGQCCSTCITRPCTMYGPPCTL